MESTDGCGNGHRSYGRQDADDYSDGLFGDQGGVTGYASFPDSSFYLVICCLAPLIFI